MHTFVKNKQFICKTSLIRLESRAEEVTELTPETVVEALPEMVRDDHFSYLPPEQIGLANV